MARFRGVVPLSEYRLYCLNESGRFTKSHDIDARDDEEALAKARTMKLPVLCELWSRDRFVAKLPPHK
jgi:hypothetical protein